MDTQVLGTPTLAAEVDAAAPDRRNTFTQASLFVGKLVVSAACFWYALRQIDVSEALRTLPIFDFRWAALAVALAMMQILLLALRLWAVVQALTPKAARLTYLAASAVSAIYALFAQVLPSVVGEGIRVWMLTRFGCGWRAGLTSVMIDRGVGVAVLVTFAFVILLLPSALTALSGYRDLTLIVFGAALAGGGLALFATPIVAPLLQRWRYSYWVGAFAADAHRVLLGPRADHPHHLAGGTRPGTVAADPRLRRAFHGHGRRGARADFGRWLGTSRAGGCLAAERPRTCTRAGVDLFGVFWTGRGDRRSARSDRLASLPAAAPCRRWVRGAGIIAIHSRHSSISCGRWRASSVPFTSMTRPRPPLSKRLISGQPAVR
jgi:hypothetical protein